MNTILPLTCTQIAWMMRLFDIIHPDAWKNAQEIIDNMSDIEKSEIRQKIYEIIDVTYGCIVTQFGGPLQSNQYELTYDSPTFILKYYEKEVFRC